MTLPSDRLRALASNQRGSTQAELFALAVLLDLGKGLDALAHAHTAWARGDSLVQVWAAAESILVRALGERATTYADIAAIRERAGEWARGYLTCREREIRRRAA